MTRLLARSLGRVIQLPPPARGQFGPNHTVVEVLKPDAWIDQDPFILLMDDRLDGRLVAGPHPHAGFETVTFPLEGGMQSESGAGRLRPGGDSVLTLANDGPEPMRLLLYTGERQGVPLVSYGPFIGDTRDDIVRSFERYKTGTFQRY